MRARIAAACLAALVGPGVSGRSIYQDVAIEARRRIHVHDLFVRPLDEAGRAEAWIEVFNCDPKPETVALEMSVAGQNLAADVLHGSV